MKIRVLIVEDEPPIARAIAQLVAADARFEVAGMEMNGYDALGRFETTPIDVVITDVNMPIMDGLSLAAYVEQHHPEVIKVVVSGYQKFEYAQEAIGYRVVEYLLKPVTKQKVAALLDKLYTMWHRRKVETRTREITRALDGQPLQTGGPAENMLLMLSAGFYWGADTHFSPAQVFWNSIDLPTMLGKVVADSFRPYISHGQNNGEIAVVLYSRSHQHTVAGIETLYQQLLAKTSLPLTLAYSGLIPLDRLMDTRRELQSAIRRSALLFSSQLIGDAAERQDGKTQYTARQVDELVRAVCAMDEALVARQFGQLLEQMREKEGTQQSMYRFLRSTIHDGRISGRINMRQYEEVQRDLLEAMANHAENEPLARDIASILVQVVSPPDDTESKKDIRNTVEEMEEYLQNNYMHPISSEVLAGVFGYVPSYLSKVFRQIKGITPSEYLVRLRVNRARELWRENPGRLVKDIAEEVGYNDQYYFSKVFKKETGQGPKDYQRSLLQHF